VSVVAKITDKPTEVPHEATRKQITPTEDFGDPEGEPTDPGRAHANFDRRLRVLEGGGGGSDDEGFPWYLWVVVAIVGILALVPSSADWVKARASEIRKSSPW
jgi:hypothetical protein